MITPRLRWLATLVGIATVTLLAFAPSLYNGFVDWDEPPKT